MSQNSIQGEYYFRKTEMVAGFNFSSGGNFQFFFSYGAVDRNANGSFTVEDNTVKLKSNKEPGKDFTITSQSKQATGYTITFNHPNKYLLNHIRCIFLIGDQQEEFYTDSSGEVQVDLPYCDHIYVQHMLYPDIATLVKDPTNENNRFTLALNPTLEQLSFKGIDLQQETDKILSWIPNYFLDIPGIKFVKQ